MLGFIKEESEMRKFPKNKKSIEPDSYALERAGLNQTNIKRLKSRTSVLPERASRDTQEQREVGAIDEEDEVIQHKQKYEQLRQI